MRCCQILSVTSKKKPKNPNPTPKTTKNLLPAGSSELESGVTAWLFPLALFTIYMRSWLSVAWWKILSPRPAPRNPSVCAQGPVAVVGPSCLATPSRQWGLIAKPPSNRVFRLFPLPCRWHGQACAAVVLTVRVSRVAVACRRDGERRAG